MGVCAPFLSLLFLFSNKRSEQGQTCVEKGFVAFAIASVFLGAFASASPADGVKSAFLASLCNSQTFSKKFGCFFTMGEGVKILIRGVDISQQPFIRAIKVAGINVAVALNNKLVHTMAAHSALLRGVAQI